MAPNIDKFRPKWTEGEFVEIDEPEAKSRQYTIVYPMALVMLYWHLGAAYGLYLAIRFAKWPTLLLHLFVYLIGGMGVTVGVHRLWSHRAFKATKPLQVLLMLLNTLACQRSVIEWARDHRVHHKYCDTDADPHNATRGFFFSHVGWLLVKKHPDLVEKAKTIDISDLLGNPVLRFQKKYYFILSSLLVFILPTVIPVYCWQESWVTAYHLALLRLTITTNITFAINSIAHLYGNKPYDQNVTAVQNVPLSLITFGEGYHNFHHIFPFDYRVSELGNHHFKFTTHIIDFFAWLGWAYDLKYVSDEMISNRAARTGDGTYTLHQEKQNTDIWGWGDKDMAEEDKEILNSQNLNKISSLESVKLLDKKL